MSARACGFISAVLILIFILAFCLSCRAKYLNFGYNDHDLAVANQIMWNGLRGDLLETSIEGGNYLKLHAPFIYLLLLPAYALWQSPLMLLFTQVIFLALTAWPIHLFAKRETGRPVAALSFLVLYLLYPPVGYLALRPPNGLILAPLFLAWAYYFFRTGRYPLFLSSLALALSCREEVSFIAVTFGISALWEKRGWRWWAVPLAAGAGWFGVYYFWLLPHLRGGGMSPYLIFYREVGGSPGGLLRTMATRPLHLAGVLLAPHRLGYLVKLFAPLAFTPLLSPGTLFLCAPNLFLNLASDRRDIADIALQYNALLIPFIFFAGIRGFTRLARALRPAAARRIALRSVLAVGVIASWLLGPQLHLLSRTWKGAADCLPGDDFRAPAKRALARMVPDGVPAATTFGFCSFLSNRKELDFLAWVLSGEIGSFRERHEPRSDIRYALIDLGDWITFVWYSRPGTSEAAFRRYLADNQLGLVRVWDQVALYERGREDLLRLYETVEHDPGGREPPEPIARFGPLALRECEAATVRDGLGDQIVFTTSWEATAPVPDDLSMYIRVENAAGECAPAQPRSICHHLYPTPEWRTGETIRSRQFFAIPPRLPRGRYAVKLILIGKFPPCDPIAFDAPPERVDDRGWLIAGTWEY
ncbi:MAG: DUF2079 domain-containing protein [bacterium]|nr:DUF2079 domain-containing protein [bacterium]